jgi:uncharacterized protein (TIGR02246 family)
MGNVRATIEANKRKFEQAFHQANAAGVAALYTENAYILPPGSEMMQGRAAIQSFWQAAIESGVKEAKLETLDVEEGGENLAREIGRYVLTIQQGSETVQRPGKYVMVWKQEGSDWKADVDIWNS